MNRNIDIPVLTAIRNDLGLPIKAFEKDHRGIPYKEYDTRYTFGQIVLYSIEQQPNKQESYLTLSGEGRRQLEKHLATNNQTWESFFRGCFSYFDSVIRMTRLDLAVDDKDKEQAIKQKLSMDNVKSWKRTEIQFRDEYATQMCYQIAFSQKSLGKLIFGFSKENLTFYTETGELFRPWQRFLGSVEPLKLTATTELTTLHDAQNWLETGGILAILKGFKLLEEHNALGTLQSVEQLLPQALISRSFSQKLVDHVSMLKRIDLVKMIQDQTKKAEF